MCQRTEEQEEKRAFIIQYTLNRAAAADGRLNGEEAVREAVKAWEEIIFRCK